MARLKKFEGNIFARKPSLTLFNKTIKNEKQGSLCALPALWVNVY